MAAYLAQLADKTRVSKLLGIYWHTVGSIVKRVVRRRTDPKRLGNLTRISVDEFSYRKRYRYITLMVNPRRVVWAKKGNTTEVLESFFKELASTAVWRTRR